MTTASAQFGDDGPDGGWGESANLTEIIDDIRVSLSADTATVLVVDRTRARLETTASVGLMRPVRSVPRIRIGQGFAGSVALTRRALMLDEVNSETVIDAGLVTYGVRRLLGVPIVRGGELIGVLHVGRKSDVDFSDDDVLALTEVANDLGKVLRERFIIESHATALTLQRSLLPEEIQARPGVSIAARYIPASGDLGGDWYDVFDLPTGELVLVMGDVVGHGLDAAVIMGRLRSALRAYALECNEPAEMIHRLDRKICHFEPGALSTVLVAVAAPPYAQWLVSSAGHIAPMIVTADGAAEQAAIDTDRLLGFEPSAPRRNTLIDVPEGGSLCLFTDGLVERRPTPTQTAEEVYDANLKTLAAALGLAVEPEMACIHVLTEVVGDEVMADDVALLIARRSDALP